MAKRKVKIYNSLLANLLSIVGYCVVGVGMLVLFTVSAVAGIVLVVGGLGLNKLADIVG